MAPNSWDNKRIGLRHVAGDMAVRWSAHGDPVDFQRMAYLRDFSVTGAMVLVAGTEPVAEGQSVRVQLVGDATFGAFVRRADLEDGWLHLGVEYTDQSEAYARWCDQVLDTNATERHP